MADDLGEIARRLVAKPRGILAADENLPTIAKRFEGVGVENTEENRRAYREMLLTAPGLNGYISGMILFDETLYQETAEGRPFVEVLNEQGIIPIIKVDKGTKDSRYAPGEKETEGLVGLHKRLENYRNQGARAAKWRAVFSIDEGKFLPTEKAISLNAQGLANYAEICQKYGLVPIVEPEVLMDGPHSLETCFDVTNVVLYEVFNALEKHGIKYHGMLLKPNMVVPGKDHPHKNGASEVAERTTEVLQANVPKDVPGIAFLSGGLSDKDATIYLNAMNLPDSAVEVPWNLTFSFGRALLREALALFAKGPEYFSKAQEALLRRAQETSLATQGLYKA